MAKINFGGIEEEVITSEEFSLEKAREVLKDEIVVVLVIVPGHVRSPLWRCLA